MKHTFLPNRSTLHRATRIFILIALILAGCAAPSPQIPSPGPDISLSTKPRLSALSFETARVPQLVVGNTNLAFDLYRKIFDHEANLVYSPYSISHSLSMVYAGSSGETDVQMAETLHFDMPKSQLHPAFNALDQALIHREQDQLHIKNSLWGSQGSGYPKPFLDTLAENYGTGIRLVDFSNSEQAVQRINQWVGEETEGRIPELMPPGAIQENTNLVLTNAVYFEAGWKQVFNTENTQDETFTLLDGKPVSLPLMNGIFELPYVQVGEIQAVDLPYEGGDFSMLILLPEASSFESTVEKLDSRTLNTIIKAMAPTSVQVSLPKFQFDSSVKIKDPLIALGMVDAFGDADFSGIDGSSELYIDDVYHQTIINVDEAGTEAAAGSAVEMSRKGFPTAEIEFKVDHPFIFLVRDVESGTVLFLGHIINPEL